MLKNMLLFPSIFPQKNPKRMKILYQKNHWLASVFPFLGILHPGDWKKKQKTKKANVIGTKTFFSIKKWPKVTKVTTFIASVQF